MLLTALISMISRKQKMKTFVKYIRLIFEDSNFFSSNVILKINRNTTLSKQARTRLKKHYAKRRVTIKFKKIANG